MNPTRLAHYDITERLGAGGMGEVYRARDTKLGRDVALKVLPDAFARDPERLARFEREARLLASLSHPHIGSIFGLEEDRGVRFLVLELVSGEDLSQRIARGAIPVDEALALAQQVAGALEAAHEAGVIHRDLKPANIVVTPSGTVKVLDFGLAKAFDPSTNASNLSQSPTLLGSSPTLQGVILGTAAYMSPEQARGKTVDKRADIFAFGCVLWEMLTGRQLFSGETVSDTLAAVLRADVDWTALPKETPRAVGHLLRRCLEKDPKRRLRDIGEAIVVLDDVRAGRSIEEPAAVGAPSLPKQRFVTPRAAAVVVSLLAVVAAASSVITRMSARQEVDRPLRKFLVDVTGADSLGFPNAPRISPDGRRIAYVSDGRLWIHDFEQMESREIANANSEIAPFWSPDGQHVGFAQARRLWRVPASAGEPTPICQSPAAIGGGAGATWGEDGRILFSYGNGGIYGVSASGGDPVEVVPVDASVEQDIHEPSNLPGGKGVIFIQHRSRKSPDTIQVIANGTRTTLLQLEGQNLQSPVYSPTGHILFVRLPDNAGLWALPFSLDALSATGDAFLVAARGSEPSTASDGTLAYAPTLAGDEVRLAWYAPNGEFLAAASEPFRSVTSMALSPDERRVAVSMRETLTRDVYVLDFERGTRSRLTFHGSYNAQPAWSPDGRTLAFRENDDQRVFVVPADGTEQPRLLAARAGLPSFTPDGKRVVITAPAGAAGTKSDLFTIDATGADTTRVPLFAGIGNDRYGAVSPDGRYLSFVSDETGADVLFLTTYPDATGKWQVSVNDDARWPRWAPDSRAIYYLSGDDIMMVTVEAGSPPRLGTPRAVLNASKVRMEQWGTAKFDIARDGRILLVQVIAASEGNRSVVVTQNWMREFTARESSPGAR